MLSELLSENKLYLASKSQRRVQLLKGLDLDFKQIDIDVEEIWPEGMELLEIPEYLAKLKSQGLKSGLKEEDIVITADTAVFCDNEILNKPIDESEAVKMLQKLSGNSHTVVTGVCLRSAQKTYSFSDRTKVYFENLSEKEIAYYIKAYQPFDKAGSYGAQDWIGYIGIQRLEGSYYNVMGLPVRKVYRALLNFV
ncbi:MAG: Maf family nucleotide pyrophosphatase [Bacteroidota bacterium]